MIRIVIFSSYYYNVVKENINFYESTLQFFDDLIEISENLGTFNENPE